MGEEGNCKGLEILVPQGARVGGEDPSRHPVRVPHCTWENPANRRPLPIPDTCYLLAVAAFRSPSVSVKDPGQVNIASKSHPVPMD